MPSPPERILLFRSGRHLGIALEAVRRTWPGCDVTVIATPPAAGALDAAGIDAAHRLCYDATPFFKPWPFLTSATWRAAVAGRYARVVVLWNDPDGVGQTNVDYTALMVAPRGFTAVTPDGRLLPRRTVATLRRVIGRAALSMVVAGAMAVTLWGPARLARGARWALGRPARA